MRTAESSSQSVSWGESRVLFYWGLDFCLFKLALRIINKNHYQVPLTKFVPFDLCLRNESWLFSDTLLRIDGTSSYRYFLQFYQPLWYCFYLYPFAIISLSSSFVILSVVFPPFFIYFSWYFLTYSISSNCIYFFILHNIKRHLFFDWSIYFNGILTRLRLLYA